MRILTLTQPWATLVAVGAKRVETRSWRTDYRGELGIHAAKGFPKWAQELAYVEPFASTLRAAGIRMATELPRSAILAVVELQDVVPTENLDWISANERAFGDYGPDRYGWVFGAAAQRLQQPIPCSGHLGLWTPEPHVRGSLAEQGFAT